MKISIVVPVYNAEQYIDECVQSVINQTQEDWELILVDDGSIDRSPLICDTYLEKHADRIKVFHKKNEGQYLTRIYGINQSSGDYVAFLDADDFLDKEFVKTIVKCVEKHEPDVICFGFYEWDKVIVKERRLVCNGTIECFQTVEEKATVYDHIVSGKMTGSLWSKVFKRKCIKEQDIDDISVVVEKRYGEDAFHSFSIMLNVNKIVYLDHELYYYRMNQNGASQGFFYRDLDYFNTKYVFEVLKNGLIKSNMGTEAFLNKLYARNFNETVYYMLQYYRNAKTMKRKIKVIQYDWSQYLLDMEIKDIEANEFVRKPYIKVWKAFQKKKYLTIYFREKFKKIMGW